MSANYVANYFSQNNLVPSKQQYLASVNKSIIAMNKSQSEPLHDEQVENNAGGYVYSVSDMVQFKRFLFLGSEKGTYYVSESKLTVENLNSLDRIVKSGKGDEALDFMIEVNRDNRAAKSGPTTFALALMAKTGDDKLKKRAYSLLPDFIRIPTHLFEFLEYSKVISKEVHKSTGWGRLQREFVKRWYEEKPVDTLTYQVTKYQQRNGWSHRDVLRLIHLKAESSEDDRQVLYKWIVKKELPEKEESKSEKTLSFLKAFTELQTVTDEQKVAEMIKEYRFVREHVPTNMLNSKIVWEQLLTEMPMTAMIRSLNKLTNIGLLESGGYLDLVCRKLTDEELLKKARIHPLKLLVSSLTYGKGQGDKGKMTWTPNQKICDALDEAYYKSFKYAQPTGKRYLIGLDVSGSMTNGSCIGTSITPREGSAALALTLMAMEKNIIVKGFCGKLVDVQISPRRRLDDNIATINRMSFGATDLSLPIRYASENDIQVDCFIVLSDNETWCGQNHPSECLRAYREKMNINAKYVNVQMTATKFSVADPEDMNSLEIAGFDSGMLETIAEFMSW